MSSGQGTGGLGDLSEACNSLLNASDMDTNTTFFATTSRQQTVVAIMGA
jgi:hypothetical protein